MQQRIHFFMIFALFIAIPISGQVAKSSISNNMTRIIYIPGFGEKANIFDKIAPNIPAKEILFLDNWELLGDRPKRKIDVLQYATELVAKYQITNQDIIIGHSMGGWIAYHIKHITGCRIVQIGSWTAPDRVILPIKNRHLIYFCTKTGIYLNRFTLQYAVKRGYKGKPSEVIFVETFERLKNGSKNNVINQLRLILTPVKTEINVLPDLRIHAKADKIIRYPKATFHEVPGDHFTLYTHPETVYMAINQFLYSQ